MQVKDIQHGGRDAPRNVAKMSHIRLGRLGLVFFGRAQVFNVLIKAAFEASFRGNSIHTVSYSLDFGQTKIVDFVGSHFGGGMKFQTVLVVSGAIRIALHGTRFGAAFRNVFDFQKVGQFEPGRRNLFLNRDATLILQIFFVRRKDPLDGFRKGRQSTFNGTPNLFHDAFHRCLTRSALLV